MKRVYVEPKIEVLEMEPMAMYATSYAATIEEPMDLEHLISDEEEPSPQSGTELMTLDDWSSIGWD